MIRYSEYETEIEFEKIISINNVIRIQKNRFRWYRLQIAVL